MIEFRIGAYVYRARPMNALTQFDVMSKLAPVFAAGVTDLVPMIIKIKEQGAAAVFGQPQEGSEASAGGKDQAREKGEAGADALGVALGALQPVAKAFATMSDETRRDVLHAALDLVERKGDAEQGWSKVWNGASRSPMFTDIATDATLMIRIAFEVLKGTFLPFFKGFMPA